MPYPILYSLQHCPYAMRARLGILLSKQQVMLRAIVLKDKPAEMLIASPKGTVPVLVLHDEVAGVSVIDESLEIMLWALSATDPQNLLHRETSAALPEMLRLIERNDLEFIPVLEKYKSAKRYHDDSKCYYRDQCELFVSHLEESLSRHEFFMGDRLSLADYAILPFIRQFARVERQWYLQAPYPNLRSWLGKQLQQPLFTKAMAKHPLWLDCHNAFLLNER